MRDTVHFRAPLLEPRQLGKHFWGYERRLQRFVRSYAALVNEHCGRLPDEVIVRIDETPDETHLGVRREVRLAEMSTTVALPAAELLFSELLYADTLLRGRARPVHARAVDVTFRSSLAPRTVLSSRVLSVRPESAALVHLLQRRYGAFEERAHLEAVLALDPQFARCAWAVEDQAPLPVPGCLNDADDAFRLRGAVRDLRGANRRFLALAAGEREAASGLAPSWEGSLEELFDAACLV